MSTNIFDILNQTALTKAEPSEVTIVRPKLDPPKAFGILIGRIAGFFLTAWLIMLLTPHVIDFAPGYWQTVAALVILRAVQRPLLNLDLWSKAGK